MPYSDLSAYALMQPREMVATYVREHGLAGLRGLGQAVSADVAAANLAAAQAWVTAHPLPDDASADAVQTRALVLAAIAAATAKLATGAGGSQSPEYQQAAATYNTYKAQAYQQDMPSPFALSLANFFGPGGPLDLSVGLNKVLVYGGTVLAAYVLLPRVLQGVSGSRRWE